MSEIHFDVDVDEDRVEITAIHNQNKVGVIVLEFIIDAYREFEPTIEDTSNDFTESDYDKIFPNDRFTNIEYLKVVDGERGKGYAKLLMNKALSYARSKGETVMYLNASPMGFTGLNINDLVGFYKTLGFQPLVDAGHNVEMFLNL